MTNTTSTKIHTILRNRQRLRSLLPAIVEHAETELPSDIQQRMEAWSRAVEDVRLYLAGMTQTAIGQMHFPYNSRQMVERRIVSVARQVLERHPELLQGGDSG